MIAAAPVRNTLSASTLIGNEVRNREGEDLGRIEDFMMDRETGRVAYAVLSFGGFLGVGNKLFAVPWDAFTIDSLHHASYGSALPEELGYALIPPLKRARTLLDRVQQLIHEEDSHVRVR